jgi:hypothetical protein
MAWKMSTDLSRALVPSMGQHDPLDGFVTCVQLRTTAALLGTESSGPDLRECAADFADMARPLDLRTTDPLGIGGLLMDACRVAQLERQGAPLEAELLERLLEAAGHGLAIWSRQGDLAEPPWRRLAFRELGLAIGLAGVEVTGTEVRAEPLRFTARTQALLGAFSPYLALGREIESFWLDPDHRRDPTWAEHRDIDCVMLATRLVPDGFLVLQSPKG